MPAFFMPEGALVRIGITNTLSDSAYVNMRCGLFEKSLRIPSYGTEIQMISISDLKGRLSFAGEAASCDITSDASVSALRVAGIVSGKHDYAAPIRFYDPTTATFLNLTAVGADTSADTVVAIHNLMDQPIQYTPVISEATLDEPRKVTLPKDLLPPLG